MYPVLRVYYSVERCYQNIKFAGHSWSDTFRVCQSRREGINNILLDYTLFVSF